MPDTYGGYTLEQLNLLLEKAFKRPWTYRRFEIDFEHDAYKCDEGTEMVDAIEVEAPDEYPDGQCVCQQNVILVPGLERFAEANGALICGAVNALPDLIYELDAVKAQRDAMVDEINEILNSCHEQEPLSYSATIVHILKQVLAAGEVAKE